MTTMPFCEDARELFALVIRSLAVICELMNHEALIDVAEHMLFVSA